MKTYICISLFINFLLCSVYYKAYYFEKHFHNYEEIENAMAKSNTTLQKSTERMVEDIQDELNRKPRLQIPLNNFFSCRSESLNCSISEINLLLQAPTIDETSFQNAVALSLKIRQELKDLFAQTFGSKELMKECKLKQKDVDAEVESLNKNCFLKPHFSQYTTKNLSQKEKRFILQSILLDLRNIKTNSSNKLASCVGGKRMGGGGGRFPVIFSNQSAVKMGDHFKAEIGIGAYSSNFSENASIYWDGKKVELKDGIGVVKIKAEKLGYQKHQGVLLTLDSNREKLYTDTSYFQFYVTP